MAVAKRIDSEGETRRRGGCFGRVIRFFARTVVVLYAIYGVIAWHMPGLRPDVDRALRQAVGAVTGAVSGHVGGGRSAEPTDAPTAEPNVTNKPDQTAAPASVAATAAPAGTAEAFQPIRRGDKGDRVKEVQKRLIELNYLTGGADGSYGRGTEAAVCAFQRDAYLPVTGEVDGNTYAALFSPHAPSATPAPTAAPAGQIRREVKEFVDGYEAFMNDYIDLMETPDYSSIVWLGKYTKMVADYADWAQKLDDLDESDWTSAEVGYLADAEARILARMTRAGVSL